MNMKSVCKRYSGSRKTIFAILMYSPPIRNPHIASETYYLKESLREDCRINLTGKINIQRRCHNDSWVIMF